MFLFKLLMKTQQRLVYDAETSKPLSQPDILWNL